MVRKDGTRMMHERSVDPPNREHHPDCLLADDHTGYQCVDCGEEIKDTAEHCDNSLCLAQRYDRSIPTDVYDNGPIFREAECSCNERAYDHYIESYHY